MTKLDGHAEALARALVRAAEEHGVPNRFSPGELQAYYGGPPPRFAGLVASTMNVDLNRRLAVSGYRVSYSSSRSFSVESAPKPSDEADGPDGAEAPAPGR